MPNSLKVPYTNLRNPLGEITPRPILEMELTYKASSISVSGLVDSGADVNVLPYSMGLALGLVWGEPTFKIRLSGNLANFDTRAVLLSAAIDDLEPVDLAFVWTQSDQTRLIFGQTNFFQVFNVCFFRSDSYFTLTAKNNSKPEQ